jgi:dolichol-phosphate mannosyltransferase
MSLRYSVVIPAYNEAGNLLPLLEACVGEVARLGNTFEIVIVDDGSTDATPGEISLAATRWPQVRVLHHSRNAGQAASLLEGLRAARGELILTLDGDGQNDPRDFALLVGAVESGACDLACGWRVDRQDSPLREALSHVGNAVRRRILGDPLHDTGCQLRAMRREIVDVLFEVDLLQSFLPAIARAAGFRVSEFPVRHHPRLHGKPHFGLRQLWWRPAVAMLAVRRRLRTMGRTQRRATTR